MIMGADFSMAVPTLGLAMLRRLLLPVFVIAISVLLADDATAMRQRTVRHPSFSQLDVPPVDVFSFSEPAKIRVTHLSLDLSVDFAERRLRGSATLSLNNISGTDRLVLDTRALTITAVSQDGIPAIWSLGTQTENGRPLRIDIEPSTRQVRVEYFTSPEAPGLFWNTAAQSYGRQRPYLYSLNEPDEARSWIPIQDTPTVRITYDATVRVPGDLLALMSAENNPTATDPAGVYSFRMTHSVPAYLVALAVGRLEFHAFDERTGVYVEPELLSDAVWELAYLPEMVDIAESIAGSFPFSRHDVLLMPPTFVVGGMEHPMLNFINPFSVVSGNRPEIVDPKNLIAHELAHSWSGDATTLGSWDDVWLNEGITSYLAVRILEVMQGSERADYQFFVDRAGYASFAAQVQDKTATVMHHKVPYASYGFSSTSYVKGSLFIKTLEDRLGRSVFDAFLRDYFATFRFRWVDHRNFLALLRATVAVKENDLLLEQWIYGTGLPANITAPLASSFYTRVLSRTQAFNGGTPISTLQPQTWTAPESDLFLQLANLTSARLPDVDAALGLSLRVAPPVPWLHAAARANYAPAMPAIERMLIRGGGNSLMTGLYQSLATTQAGRTRAIAIFSQSRDRYADWVETQIAQILGIPATGANAA
jgi:leukotriene-A4 hydrolase